MVVRPAVLIVALFVAHDFEGTVGNHLVGVHVHRRTGTTLHHVNGELVVQFAFYNLLAGFLNSFCDFVVDDTQGVVRLNSRPLHISDGDDVVGIVTHASVRDAVVVDTALCLDAIVGIFRNLQFTEQVRFDSEFFFSHSFLSYMLTNQFSSVVFIVALFRYHVISLCRHFIKSISAGT